MISRRILAQAVALGVATSVLPGFGAEALAQGKSPVGVRRAVKNGTDPDAAQVNPKPRKTTVEQLLDLPRPLRLQSEEPDPELEEHRVGPVETTIWELEAEVIAHQLMPDGDFRVVLRGASGRSLVVELPDPKLAPKSHWAKELAEVRKQFEEKFHPKKELQEAAVPVRLQGVGHFGKVFVKAVPNNLSGIRLQPVVKIEWPAKTPAK
jgi:hypothetical protein